MSPTTNGKRNFHFQKYNCLSIHPCLGKKHRKIDQRLLDLLDRKSKLETIIETSTVLGGCAIVVLVEFSTDSYPNVSSRDGVLTAMYFTRNKSALHQNVCLINDKNQEPMSTFSIHIDIAWLLSTVFGSLLIIFELGLIF
ncbi:unnamed protein product [Rotaria magnacalcarata]|uniref:Uncharacterized protein n=1 Tax=Rotaria magnacalcarata TaxID=392030 RepID=A0A816PVC8_9BILA|nr:unnamed protein product [Rotaria magnacalcarata]CAF4071140.1 unnamed protein product [Rotaria magnacalcarata]CAF4078675.1 unnamed protein product [Rotaria magnacalcarata]CAF4103311.1 unnamed protein product [Rotaria magnacalcarata]